MWSTFLIATAETRPRRELTDTKFRIPLLLLGSQMIHVKCNGEVKVSSKVDGIRVCQAGGKFGVYGWTSCA